MLLALESKYFHNSFFFLDLNSNGILCINCGKTQNDTLQAIAYVASGLPFIQQSYIISEDTVLSLS